MRIDPLLWIVLVLFGMPVVAGLGWLVYLFVSVVFLGGSSECPLHSCL